LIDEIENLGGEAETSLPSCAKSEPSFVRVTRREEYSFGGSAVIDIDRMGLLGWSGLLVSPTLMHHI
jgi:hypothetical protein